MTEAQRIKKSTGIEESQCSCKTCASMCKQTPCLGTPDDIKKLIDNGHINKISATLWLAGMFIDGTPPIQMATPLRTNFGCIFHQNDLCQLHDSGLKPIEGKLAKHDVYGENTSVTTTVAKTWADPANKKTIDFIFKALVRFNDTTDK